ncbi:MAG: hypothetical protein ACEY26_00515 [Candidatus Hodgkinia cicadicola]
MLNLNFQLLKLSSIRTISIKVSSLWNPNHNELYLKTVVTRFVRKNHKASLCC